MFLHTCRSPSTHRMSPWVRKVFIQVMPRILFMKRPHYMPRYSTEPPDKLGTGGGSSVRENTTTCDSNTL